MDTLNQSRGSVTLYTLRSGVNWEGMGGTRVSPNMRLLIEEVVLNSLKLVGLPNKLPLYFLTRDDPGFFSENLVGPPQCQSYHGDEGTMGE